MITFERRLTRAIYARALRRQMRKVQGFAVLWIVVAAAIETQFGRNEIPWICR